MKALQHLLTHSASGKLLAVRRVTENDGRRTPGVDGELWDTPHKKLQGVILADGTGLPPHASAADLHPEGQWEAPTARNPDDAGSSHASACICWRSTRSRRRLRIRTPTAFGRGEVVRTRLNSASLRSVTKTLAWVLEGDIKGCFDNISHQWLLDNVPMNKAILRKWLKSGYLEKQVLYDTISGTPQGGIISPVLSNIALDGLERRLREVFPVRGKGSDRGAGSAGAPDPLCG